jgi:hypothetical protein
VRKALLLVLLTGTAAAQTQKPAPLPAEQNPPAPTRPLNLKLDGRAGDYTREAPRDATAENLPGLGDGAMAIDKLPTPRSETVRTPYPESR